MFFKEIFILCISFFSCWLFSFKDSILPSDKASKNLANQIADKLVIIESNRKLLKFFGTNSRKIVEKNFNVELIISKYLEVYNSLLK